MHEAVSLRPRNVEKLQDGGRLSRRGRVKLTGPKGESISIPEPLYSLLNDAVRNLMQGRSLALIPEATHHPTVRRVAGSVAAILDSVARCQ